ncbi:hypothetical protein OHA98_00895 [Streptomyces sp. NBC_00654]|uniref:hypothetical protein n=1 Tax=Streptomyces sp. NBC_00654 TaxID=2975799 RepID=UPI00224F34B7|nr:hypothetical protein [Streptomyces sp. NBC_00654]MCX4963392.1 hypothetical protein [Streptomyces sp. NBC_00654]
MARVVDDTLLAGAAVTASPAARALVPAPSATASSAASAGPMACGVRLFAAPPPATALCGTTGLGAAPVRALLAMGSGR